MAKSPPASTGDSIRDMGSIPESGRSPGGGHSNPLVFLLWKIPWTKEPGRLQSIGSHRVGHDEATEQQTTIIIHKGTFYFCNDNLRLHINYSK